MVKPFSQIAPDLQRLSGKLERGATRIAKRAAMVIHRTVAENTPVDTGQARSNWVTTLVAPFAGFRGAYAPGRHLGRGERANLAAGQQQTRIAISPFNSKTGASIFITNNTPYLRFLDQLGTSSQASPGFVRRAVAAGAASVRGIRLIN